MPFFSRREPEEEEVVTPTPVEPEHKHHGLFGRRDPSPTPTARTASTRYSTSTYQTSPTRASSDAGSLTSNNRRSLLHRTFGNGNAEMDPSIVAARERVMSAENAEKEADRALEIARREVREAREHVRRLELEAKEEARLAKIKQYHAKEVGKRGKALGRKYPAVDTHCDLLVLTPSEQGMVFKLLSVSTSDTDPPLYY